MDRVTASMRNDSLRGSETREAAPTSDAATFASRPHHGYAGPGRFCDEASRRSALVLCFSLGPRAECSLGDYVRASCMLQYNNRDSSLSSKDRRAKLFQETKETKEKTPAAEKG